MARAELAIHFVTGEIRNGGWCARCALPSLVEVDVYAMSSQGVCAGVSKVQTIRACTEHDDPEAPR